MGVFEVGVGVRGKNGGGRVEVVAMVDTGATDTVIPPSILMEVGVEVEARRRFTLADGSHALSWGLVKRVYPSTTRSGPAPLSSGIDEEQIALGRNHPGGIQPDGRSRAGRAGPKGVARKADIERMPLLVPPGFLPSQEWWLSPCPVR